MRGERAAVKRRGRTDVKEDICSIPVNEVFEVKDGCPICRMHDTLEDRMLSFILGDAMMEPDVRIETNRQGFCGRHSLMMLERRNRLALALMLESRLKTVEEAARRAAGGRPVKKRGSAAPQAESCYVCGKTDAALDGLITTFFHLWKKEEEFRENVKAQPLVCLPHYLLLLDRAGSALDKKEYPVFGAALTDVLLRGLLPLEEDVTGFCRMFDYRNNGAEWGTKKDAPERAVAFLTGLKKQ